VVVVVVVCVSVCLLEREREREREKEGGVVERRGESERGRKPQDLLKKFETVLV
jgi:hypothetical protein